MPAWKNHDMPEIESGALERGREAFEPRAWGAAFDQLRSSDATGSLAPEDLERLGEAARWSRHFDEMFDIFERASAAYESGGDRRSAARVAVKLTVEHHARHGDALAAGWLARAGRLLEGEPACRERGLVLMCAAQGMFFMGDGPAALHMSQEMVQLGSELQDRDIEALGRLALGHARLLVGEVREGTALIDEAMAAALVAPVDLVDVHVDTLAEGSNSGQPGRFSAQRFSLAGIAATGAGPANGVSRRCAGASGSR
jgi:hypothetical protein